MDGQEKQPIGGDSLPARGSSNLISSHFDTKLEEIVFPSLAPSKKAYIKNIEFLLIIIRYFVIEVIDCSREKKHGFVQGKVLVK